VFLIFKKRAQTVPKKEYFLVSGVHDLGVTHQWHYSLARHFSPRSSYVCFLSFAFMFSIHHRTKFQVLIIKIKVQCLFYWLNSFTAYWFSNITLYYYYSLIMITV